MQHGNVTKRLITFDFCQNLHSWAWWFCSHQTEADAPNAPDWCIWCVWCIWFTQPKTDQIRIWCIWCVWCIWDLVRIWSGAFGASGSVYAPDAPIWCIWCIWFSLVRTEPQNLLGIITVGKETSVISFGLAPEAVEISLAARFGFSGELVMVSSIQSR